MLTRDENAAWLETKAAGGECYQRRAECTPVAGCSQHTKVPPKWKRILAVFLTGRSLNRFEAERLSDHCLHSTVSTLESKGVVILRKSEKVSGYMGIPTEVTRYWLASDSFEMAHQLMGNHLKAAA